MLCFAWFRLVNSSQRFDLYFENWFILYECMICGFQFAMLLSVGHLSIFIHVCGAVCAQELHLNYITSFHVQAFQLCRMPRIQTLQHDVLIV